MGKRSKSHQKAKVVYFGQATFQIYLPDDPNSGNLVFADSPKTCVDVIIAYNDVIRAPVSDSPLVRPDTPSGGGTVAVGPSSGSIVSTVDESDGINPSITILCCNKLFEGKLKG